MHEPDINDIQATAGETAGELLSDALDFIQPFLEYPGLQSLPPSHAVLLAAFALLKQREAHYEERRLELLASQTSRPAIN